MKNLDVRPVRQVMAYSQSTLSQDGRHTEYSGIEALVLCDESQCENRHSCTDRLRSSQLHLSVAPQKRGENVYLDQCSVESDPSRPSESN